MNIKQAQKHYRVQRHYKAHTKVYNPPEVVHHWTTVTRFRNGRTIKSRVCDVGAGAAAYPHYRDDITCPQCTKLLAPRLLRLIDNYATGRTSLRRPNLQIMQPDIGDLIQSIIQSITIIKR